jgi:8-oxo-dGTP diphosphatase
MIQCQFEDGNAAKLRHGVVDALVVSGGRILLVKRTAKLIEGGKWGLPGGYMERDETIFQAAEREILEETGWTVNNLKLLLVNSSPSRPKEDRQNIAFVVTCDASKKTGEGDWESDEVRWFQVAEVTSKLELAFDHASNIQLYLDRQATQPNSPLVI